MNLSPTCRRVYRLVVTCWLALVTGHAFAGAKPATELNNNLQLNAGNPGQWVSMADSVTIAQAYFRRPIPGAKVTAAYVQIQNPSSQAVILLGYHSQMAGKVELHESSMQDGMMRMREIKRHAIAAGTALNMQPGGYHLMLFDLASTVTKADMIQITLEFADQTTRAVQFAAQALK